MVFDFFKEISAIPRGSFNESAIADYLYAFAETRGLFFHRDSLNNVFIRKAASVGMENAAPVLLQGHSDMVCEKNADVVHDFEKDGINLIIDGDIVHADGTTLGADDGTAVAMMLALLDDNVLILPEIECLFTTCEEVGLQGTAGFDCSMINSRTMINIDIDSEDDIIVSCAGGVKSKMTLPLGDMRAADEDYVSLSMFVNGLAGGHSGSDIHLDRGNANKIAAHILLKIISNFNSVRLALINGGNKDNAIPRECEVIFAVKHVDKTAVIETIRAETQIIKKALTSADSEFEVAVDDASKTLQFASIEKTKMTAELLNITPNGVMSMSKTIHGMVETSINTGVIRTEADTLKITFAPRSSSETQLDDIMRKLDSFTALIPGASIEHNSRYPGWEAVENSQIREKYVNTFEQLNGRAPKVIALHAGLECGLIKSKIPDMDIISIGPNVYDIHTPHERMSISSLNRVYAALCAVLSSAD